MVLQSPPSELAVVTTEPTRPRRRTLAERRASRCCLALALLVLSAAPSWGEGIECPSGTVTRGGPPPEGVKQWCERSDRSQHGPSLSWYPTGEKLAEAQFDEGRLTGNFRRWYQNGQLGEQGRYRDGQREGEHTMWDENGVVRMRRNFDGGKPDGAWEAFFPNGRLRVSERFSDGLKDGPVATYFETGQQEVEGEYRKGELHGTWTAWYADGFVRRLAKYEKGKAVSEQVFESGEKPAAD